MDRTDAGLSQCEGANMNSLPAMSRRTILAAAGGLALTTARRGYAATPAERKNGTMDIKRNGSRPSGKGPETWFTGMVRVDPLFQAGDPTRVSGGQVTFEPGARTMWHTHPLGQTLIVTSGLGWVQCEGGPIEEAAPATLSGFRLARSIGMARRRRPL